MLNMVCLVKLCFMSFSKITEFFIICLLKIYSYAMLMEKFPLPFLMSQKNYWYLYIHLVSSHFNKFSQQFLEFFTGISNFSLRCQVFFSFLNIFLMHALYYPKQGQAMQYSFATWRKRLLTISVLRNFLPNKSGKACLLLLSGKSQIFAFLPP